MHISRMVSNAVCLFLIEQVADCEDAIDSDLDGKFRHGQNVVTSVSAGLINYKMDCASPPPLPTEALSGSGDSGGCVSRDRGDCTSS